MRHPYRLLLTILALVLGGTVWHVSRLALVGPAEGTALEGEVTRPQPSRLAGKPTAPAAFRIGTFNLHGCKGTDGRRDVDRVAECLRDLDFVALNEVRGPRPWQDLDQAGQLGVRLGLAWLFAPNTRAWCWLDSGNGLLSAMPVTFWQRIPLAKRSGRGHRNAVLVGLTHGRRTVRVLLTHVTRQDDRSRQEQLRAVIDLFLSLAEPAVLLGDLNSDASDPAVRRLLSAPGVSDAVGGILGAKDPPRIDWIVVRGLRCVDAGIDDRGASDHPLVWAELE